LPCNVVDEALYDNPPSLLIATIDKFTFLWGNEIFKVGASVGLVEINSHSINAENILKVASQRLQSVRYLKCHGVDTTFESPDQHGNCDLVIILAAPDKARVMAADHVGVELEFMYKLCESELKALENGDYEAAAEIAKIEYDFMREHIVEWVPMFLINVKNEAGTAFYFDVADLALEFVLSDFEYLSELKANGYNYNV